MTGRRAHPESALQTQIKKFVRDCVACPHIFAAHDRSKDHSGVQHLFEKMRGVVTGWPDTELLIPSGITFRCELKAPGKQIEADGTQAKLGAEIAALGHPWAWANSVQSYLAAARAAGVPFRPSADLRALDLDLVLAGRDPKAPGPKSYVAKKPRAPKPTAAAVRRLNAVRRRVMF